LGNEIRPYVVVWKKILRMCVLFFFSIPSIAGNPLFVSIVCFILIGQINRQIGSQSGGGYPPANNSAVSRFFRSIAARPPPWNPR
jgi:hypothetical protein